MSEVSDTKPEECVTTSNISTKTNIFQFIITRNQESAPDNGKSEVLTVTPSPAKTQVDFLDEASVHEKVTKDVRES